MGTWKTRGLRGSTLEDLINRTNDSYREKKLALIQKIPTPITPIEIDKKSRHITLAYFDMKSTVDYIGAVQGIPVCFDAKECAVRTFPSDPRPFSVSWTSDRGRFQVRRSFEGEPLRADREVSAFTFLPSGVSEACGTVCLSFREGV